MGPLMVIACAAFMVTFGLFSVIGALMVSVWLPLPTPLRMPVLLSIRMMSPTTLVLMVVTVPLVACCNQFACPSLLSVTVFAPPVTKKASLSAVHVVNVAPAVVGLQNELIPASHVPEPLVKAPAEVFQYSLPPNAEAVSNPIIVRIKARKAGGESRGCAPVEHPGCSTGLT